MAAGCAGAQKLGHGLQLLLREPVAFGQSVGPGVGDEDDFLPVVVKGDHLVEQHQVHIPELLLVRRVQPQGRLGIPDVLIGE